MNGANCPQKIEFSIDILNAGLSGNDMQQDGYDVKTQIKVYLSQAGKGFNPKLDEYEKLESILKERVFSSKDIFHTVSSLNTQRLMLDGIIGYSVIRNWDILKDYDYTSAYAFINRNYGSHIQMYKSSFEIIGLRVPMFYLSIVGSSLLSVLFLCFLTTLQHIHFLKKSKEGADVIRQFPWVLTYRSFVGRIVSISPIVGVPIGSVVCLMFYDDSAPNELVQHLKYVPIISVICMLIMSVLIVSVLRDINNDRAEEEELQGRIMVYLKKCFRKLGLRGKDKTK